MTYCSNCGKAVPDESNFCTFCGAAIAVIDPQKPTVATPVVEPTPSAVANTSAAKNVFYTNVGFWGALILMAGFFLPFYHEPIYGIDVSLSDMISYGGSSAGVYSLLLLPISAAVLILQGLAYILPPVVANIFKLLPLLLLIFCFGALMREGDASNSLSQFFKAASVGMYATLLGSVLVLFFRRKT